MEGIFIGVKGENTFTVKKTFLARRNEKVLLSCACLGLFFVMVNGKRVGKSYLMPGWTDYNHSLQIARFNLTDYISDGENEIAITVNEGWYKGPLTWERVSCFYGKINAVCVEINIGGLSVRFRTKFCGSCQGSFPR